MKLKKLSLALLFLTAKETEGELSLQEARVRDTFLNEIKQDLRTFEEDRKVIYEKFCVIDEKTGKCDLSDGNYHFDPNNLDIINKELRTLYDEEVEVPIDPKINIVLSKSKYKPKVGEVEIIDNFLSQL